MNRIIKFRVWDKIKKRFIEFDTDYKNRKGYNLGEYALSANGKLKFFEACEGGMEVEECRDVDVLFFTGLKDKNGKKIFEGDIIIESHEEVNSNDGTSWEEKHTFSVEYVECRFNIYGFVHRPASEPELEIIGNIYENPELLN